MHIRNFTYHRPGTVQEACGLAYSLGPKAHFLAGGTELLTDLKRGRVTARHIISLKDLPELSGILEEDEGIYIGALTTLEEVAQSELLKGAFPVIPESAASIGCMQIREQGTLGGNFCGAVPCADTPPACLVCGAVVRIVGREGERELPVHAFFVEPRKTVLESDEILAGIFIPKGAHGFGAAYERFSLRKGMSVAVASVAASLRMDGDTIVGARIALGAVAPIPLPAVEASTALAGKKATGKAFEQAAVTAAQEAKPICDLRGSDEYRRDIVEVLTKRALAGAAERARGGVA